MSFGIEEVSLFFKYCVGEDLGTEKLSETAVNFDCFKKIMDTLYGMYKDELKDDILKILKVNKDTCENCTKRILSKCVKLSGESDYFHFILVCTFLYGIISERYSTGICSSVLANWISSCLEAVYDRCYGKDFGSDCGSETLESYCVKLNTTLSKRKFPQDFKKMPLFDGISELMESSKEMSYYLTFKLHDSEAKMAREISEQLPDVSISEQLPDDSISEQLSVDSVPDLDDSNVSLAHFDTSYDTENDSRIHESGDTEEEDTASNVSKNNESFNGADEDQETYSYSDLSFLN